jgi:hypothetical protein
MSVVQTGYTARQARFKEPGLNFIEHKITAVGGIYGFFRKEYHIHTGYGQKFTFTDYRDHERS